jgi:hypothetical protein
MSTVDKHYKFINSKTGYVIYYHSVKPEIEADELKEALERIKDQVAISNNIYRETVYWEEIKDEQ